MEIEISNEVKDLIEKRGVREEDIREVIQYAETTGEKLYQPGTNRYLAKLRISEATFYVEYQYFGESGKYVVDTSYLHKSEIVE
jgi:glutamate synthase (NADPH/NADH) small chain